MINQPTNHEGQAQTWRVLGASVAAGLVLLVVGIVTARHLVEPAGIVGETEDAEGPELALDERAEEIRAAALSATGIPQFEFDWPSTGTLESRTVQSLSIWYGPQATTESAERELIERTRLSRSDGLLHLESSGFSAITEEGPASLLNQMRQQMGANLVPSSLWVDEDGQLNRPLNFRAQAEWSGVGVAFNSPANGCSDAQVALAQFRQVPGEICRVFRSDPVPCPEDEGAECHIIDVTTVPEPSALLSAVQEISPSTQSVSRLTVVRIWVRQRTGLLVASDSTERMIMVGSLDDGQTFDGGNTTRLQTFVTYVPDDK